MRTMLFIAAIWAVPLLSERPAWGADQSADLVLGKWAGSLKIGDSETTMELEFTKDGKGVMIIMGNTSSFKYWVLHNGDLLFLMEVSDGQGGCRTNVFEVPCKVTKDHLKMTFPKHDAKGIRLPVEYKQVQ